MLIVEDTRLEVYTEPVTVYNFEVEDFHTYHVGYCCIFVHNAKCEKMGHGKGDMSGNRNVQQKQRDSIAAELRGRGVPDNLIRWRVHLKGNRGFLNGLLIQSKELRIEDLFQMVK